MKFRGISRNYTTRNSAEFRQNCSQFRTEYGIDGSKKNRRNSVSAEFRGHPSCKVIHEEGVPNIWRNAQIRITIFEETVSHIWLCTRSLLNFFIYEETFILFFNSVHKKDDYECRRFPHDFNLFAPGSRGVFRTLWPPPPAWVLPDTPGCL